MAAAAFEPEPDKERSVLDQQDLGRDLMMSYELFMAREQRRVAFFWLVGLISLLVFFNTMSPNLAIILLVILCGIGIVVAGYYCISIHQEVMRLTKRT